MEIFSDLVSYEGLIAHTFTIWICFHIVRVKLPHFFKIFPAHLVISRIS